MQQPQQQPLKPQHSLISAVVEWRTAAALGSKRPPKAKRGYVGSAEALNAMEIAVRNTGQKEPPFCL